MTPSVKNSTGRSAVAALMLIWLAAIAAGCASSKKGAPTVPDTGSRKIVGLVAESDIDTDRIRILGNQPLTFTVVSKSSPFGVALYFPGTELALEDAHIDLESLKKGGLVTNVRPSTLATEKSTTLIEIDLKAEALYDATRQGDEVVVAFARPLHIPESEAAPIAPLAEERPAAVPAEMASVPVATRLEAVAVKRLEKGVEIRVRADGTIKDYSMFTLNDPDRIVYDIYGLTSPFIREQTIEVGTPAVRRVRHYGDPEKLRVVLDTDAEQFRTTTAVPVQKGLLIHLGDAAREEAGALGNKGADTGAVTRLNRVGSTAEPASKPSETLPSTVPDKTDSNAAAENNTGSNRVPASAAIATKERPPAIQQSDTRSVLFGVKTYVGEKIALEFYETDIKNVFRILGEVSGKNFAIDSDVRGTVTMSLDRPVPWDQVLDLVLRMNQLGQTMEGDVIRVATLDTLKKEEEALQAAITARSNTLKSQEALEPLFTEIVDINYSKPNVILPHIEDMMKEYGGDIDPVTGEEKSYRGFARAYDATNQLVIRSTRSMLEKALDLVQRLDKPTPQVLIEARIIEATKSFSRDIGSQFSIGPGTGNKFSSSTLGGDWDLALGSNFPAQTTTSGVSFDFSRLVGSPLAINAAIDASETEGETNTISAPKILTLDNKAATIKQGVSYPIVVLDEAGNTATEFKDILLELEVTPHVTKDDRVSMEIMITKNDLGERIGTDYSFTVNEATTELLVNDGETVVIGGISKTTDTNSETGLPGLRKIPILGWLFGMSSKSNNKNELMIFITPRIVQLEQRPL
jgi:type IV pilus assembly protein PilQ